jgi:hypothetical protein
MENNGLISFASNVGNSDYLRFCIVLLLEQYIKNWLSVF